MKLCFFLTALILSFCFATKTKAQPQAHTKKKASAGTTKNNKKKKRTSKSQAKPSPPPKATEPIPASSKQEPLLIEGVEIISEEKIASPEAKDPNQDAGKDDKEPETFPQEAYLDFEGRSHVSVYEHKGLNYKNCLPPSCHAKAWLENSTEFTVTGEKQILRNTLDVDGIVRDIEYYPVEVIVMNSENEPDIKRGFLEAGFVHFKKHGQKPPGPIYEIEDRKDPKDKKCTTSVMSPDIGSCDIPEITTIMNKTSFNENVEVLMKKVGQCVNPEEIKTSESSINYDHFVLPLFRKNNDGKEKITAPPILREDNKPMTQDDLINIDALARTMYGEVASCFKQGINYPLAFTQVVLNRYAATEPKSKNKEDVKIAKKFASRYIQGNHKESPKITKILTSPIQYSTWKTTDVKLSRPNPALRNALCPPSNDYNDFKNAKETTTEKKNKDSKKKQDKTIPHHVNVWHNAVQIATEAILFPKRFSKHMVGMKSDTRHFTSYMERSAAYRQQFPIIEGRGFKKDDCVQVWSIPNEL